MSEYVLGIWDGHDSGAALVRGPEVVYAVNEERLSRRKLDVGFPARSIRSCLEFAGIAPDQVSLVAATTTDPAKTLTRLFPSLKEQYYLLRRRKLERPRFAGIKKRSKYWLTELKPTGFTGALSRRIIRGELARLGFTRPRLEMVDHHLAHAATAVFASGFNPCLAFTLDGLGDGRSGSVYTFEGEAFTQVASFSARHSLGVFFEHVTNLMNMRELEDEGKVMALASYAYPVPDEENPLIGFFSTEGLQLRSRYGSLRMYDELKRILWRYPSEQFACMAQRALEVAVLSLVRQALAATGIRRVALAGGLFSNIKVNLLIAELPEVDACYAFPHMGDGGLALGAALWANFAVHDVNTCDLGHVYLGPGFTDAEARAALEAQTLPWRRPDDIARWAAELITRGEIVLWFQGRMEYGPRALGNRSILALPGSDEIKNDLNLKLKRRVWYQPFCPSLLIEEMEHHLVPQGGAANPFMTMGYRIRPEAHDALKGVINLDDTCRPQIVSDANPRYRALIEEIKRLTGRGVVLNTSFNLHGEPLVCSPGDALDMLHRSAIKYLALGDYAVEKTDD